jgi:hypothetical protein
MYTGSLPPTSLYNTWIKDIEITSADDNQLVDLTGLTEITLRLKVAGSDFNELELLLSRGEITLPSIGIIEWRVPPQRMGNLVNRLYEVILLLDDGETVETMILGSISVVS